jgi:hypothetical protein
VARRPLLSNEERLAVKAELEELYRRYGSDQAVATWLDVTQQAVHRSRTTGIVGPFVAQAVYALLGTTRDAVLEKFRAIHGTPPPERIPEDPQFEALGLPQDKFRARELAARRAVKSKQWNITPTAIRYVCTAPEWQAPQFEVRDPPFWVDVMKAQTTAEARMQPDSEEDRQFQQALRAVHAKRAKARRNGSAQANSAAGASAPVLRRRRKLA